MSVWKGENSDTAAIAHIDGMWRIYKRRDSRSRWYDDANALPKWVQKDLSLLKWMPDGVWCSLGMREEGIDYHYGREVEVMFYSLFSPVLKRQLSQLEKENQNEQ
jgi:hypothetical protein